MLVPTTCDGCGAAFTLSHALDCRLVIRRHNEIHDDLACLAYIRHSHSALLIHYKKVKPSMFACKF